MKLSFDEIDSNGKNGSRRRLHNECVQGPVLDKETSRPTAFYSNVRDASFRNRNVTM